MLYQKHISKTNIAGHMEQKKKRKKKQITNN